MKSRYVILVLSLFVATLMILSSCAGSRDQSLLAGDESWGTERPKEASDIAAGTADSSADEAEVLKLLGITKETETPVATPSAKPVGTTDLRQLESKITELESSARQKDVEIANLKSDLAEKERRISLLQQEVNKPQASAPASLSTSGVKTQYDEALALYNSRRYREAIAMFDQVIAAGAPANLVDNCQYWKGECYYALRDFNQAITQFNLVFTYNNSNKIDAAQLKLGLCHLKLGNRAQAKVEFEKLVNNYPESEYVGKAQSYLTAL